MTPCPKCGCKTWDGPRYVPTVPDYRNFKGDALSYTCTDCRFVRYETPLDRQPKESMPQWNNLLTAHIKDLQS